MDVYTTFPWAALCDEVKKLNIALRQGLVLEGEFRGLASRFAATQRNARNRWAKTATPAGFELADGHSRKHQAWRGLALFRE